MTTRVRGACPSLAALLTLLLCLLAGLTVAAEPPTEPILRIEPGMHTDAIKHIATDKAGRWLVTASNDKTARVWDISDGRLLTTLRIPIGNNYEGLLNAVALSPDGQFVAVGGAALVDEGAGNSIYIFDRASGRLLRRLIGLPHVIFHLAFSLDGLSLAATLAQNGGLYLFSVSDGRLLALDRSYSDDSYSAHFGAEGRLVTTSVDGLLRLYYFDYNRSDGSRLTLRAKRAAPGGKQPLAARFSPDGKRIAVGFGDTSAVNVLNANDLSLDYAPDTTGVNAYVVNADLASVAWSQDGATLFAAGGAQQPPNGPTQVYIRRWPNSGKGTPVNLPTAYNAISDLVALPGGRLAFGSADPAWGVVNADGTRKIFQAPTGADFRDNWEGFALSYDGSKVRFGYEAFGDSSAVFDIHGRRLLPSDTPGLMAPTFSASGLQVDDWKYTYLPKLNGMPIKLSQREMSRSLALLPSGEGFALGTDFFLHAYARNGKLLWAQHAPTVWAVNASQDGRWVVAAYGDGTIRWHRASDGVEQLAFFPHADKKRWIMWTPEGYYDSSPGGEDLIGWHLNQGKDKEARFIPSSQLYDVFFRPDIVQAKFRGEDISGLITITAAEALKNPPPILSFTKVHAPSKRNREKVCYRATSTGGGIGEVRLFQNGKLVKSDGFYRETIAKETDTKMMLASLDSSTIQRGLRNLKVVQNAPSPIASNSKGSAFEECHELETIPGENEIGVTAFNATNTIQSNMETARFWVDRKPEEPHLYVLGVGIDQYGDPSASLQYAVKDSNDFRLMMRNNAGSLYKPQNIHIEGLSDRAATKEGIQKAIQALSSKVKPWDSFILFVASHGVLLENQYFIVTAKFSGSTNRANLISSNEIVAMSKSIKSLSQLFVFDTCHAGGVDNIISGLYDARMSVMARKMGLHIYASAGSTQTAIDGYKGNGLFTHTLLQGMKEAKATDSNHDNHVSVVELGQRARQETMNLSKELGHPQSPNIINFGRDSMLFKVQ